MALLRSILLAASIVLAAIGPADAQPRQPRSCAAEIGAVDARKLARDCREADPVKPSLCRPESSCAVMTDMIQEACRLPGSTTMSVCRDQDDDDEEQDDE